MIFSSSDLIFKMPRERMQTSFYTINHGMNFEKCSKLKLKIKNRVYKAKSRGAEKKKKMKLKIKIRIPKKNKSKK